jgi:hypothetical protein
MVVFLRMPSPSRPPVPKFVGVDTYTDKDNRFQFRYPTDWAKFEIEGQADSVLFSPYRDQASPKTFISGYARDLDFDATAEDLEDLTLAVTEGLEQFAGLKIEHASNDVFGNLIKFDRTFTFVENGVTRKRHTWIMYVGRFQIVFAYQGESVEDYDYFLPMGNTLFFHIKIPDSFWYSTDRDLNKFGESKQKPE